MNYRLTASVALLIALGTSSCANTSLLSAKDTVSKPNPTPTVSFQNNASTKKLIVANVGVKPQGTSCPNNAHIKGINSKTGKFYYEKQKADYKNVKPTICFADVATAEKAGYKRSTAN